MSALHKAAPPPAPRYLHPGQIVVVAEPAIVTTILGSCVAVCLYEPEARIAGINHFLLPKNPARGTDDGRYGDTAVEELIVSMWKHGASIDRVVAKIFGGACVIASLTGKSATIGEKNAAVAREVLARHAIGIASDETGGRRGRKLLFDTGTGSAWVKEIG